MANGNYLEPSGGLLRDVMDAHDASQYCGDHQTFGKGVFPTRRRVVPRTGTGKTLPFPTLVWIQVHEAELSQT